MIRIIDIHYDNYYIAYIYITVYTAYTTAYWVSFRQVSNPFQAQLAKDAKAINLSNAL